MSYVFETVALYSFVLIVQDMIGVKYITPAELKQYEHALEDIINVVYETT